MSLKSRDQRVTSDLYYLVNSLENQENGGVVVSNEESSTANTVLLNINLRNAQNQSKTQNWGVNQQLICCTPTLLKIPYFLYPTNLIG